MVVGYVGDFRNAPALLLMELDLGISVLILVVWIMLLPYFIFDDGDVLTEVAAEYGLDACDIVFGN